MNHPHTSAKAPTQQPTQVVTWARQSGKLTALIRMAVAAAGPKGLSANEASAQTAQDRRRCVCCLSNLREDGELHAAGKHKHTRYFATKAYAKAHADAMHAKATAAALVAAMGKKVAKVKVMAALGQRGEAGADALELHAEIPSLPLKLIYNTLSRAFRDGHLHRAGPYKAFRYFLEERHATTYTQRLQLREAAAIMRAERLANGTANASQPAPAATGPKPKPHPATVQARAIPSRAAVDAPVVIRKAAAPQHQEVTYSPDLKVTIAKAPPGRYEVDEPVKYGFSTMPLGAYFAADSAVARAYGAAA